MIPTKYWMSSVSNVICVCVMTQTRIRFVSKINALNVYGAFAMLSTRWEHRENAVYPLRMSSTHCGHSPVSNQCAEHVVHGYVWFVVGIFTMSTTCCKHFCPSSKIFDVTEERDNIRRKASLSALWEVILSSLASFLSQERSPYIAMQSKCGWARRQSIKYSKNILFKFFG